MTDLPRRVGDPVHDPRDAADATRPRADGSAGADHGRRRPCAERRGQPGLALPPRRRPRGQGRLAGPYREAVQLLWRGHYAGQVAAAELSRRRRPPGGSKLQASVQYLADHFEEVPLLFFAFSRNDRDGGSTFPAVWNAMLAARAQGVGSAMTNVLDIFRPDTTKAVLGVPPDRGWTLAATVAMGYPKGRWGVAPRRPRTRSPTATGGAEPGFTIEEPLWSPPGGGPTQRFHPGPPRLPAAALRVPRCPSDLGRLRGRPRDAPYLLPAGVVPTATRRCARPGPATTPIPPWGPTSRPIWSCGSGWGGNATGTSRSSSPTPRRRWRPDASCGATVRSWRAWRGPAPGPAGPAEQLVMTVERPRGVR